MRHWIKTVGTAVLTLPWIASNPALAHDAPVVEPPVHVDNAAALKGVSRVAIGSFTVDILDRVEASADVGGIELVTGAPTDIIVNLVGTDPTRYPALVEEMYARFAADLTNAGYVVVPQAELQANADFARLKRTDPAAAKLEKTAAGHNHYISAHGLPIWMVDENWIVPRPTQIQIFGKKKDNRDPYVSWGTSLTAGFVMMDYAKQKQVAKSLGAPVLNVRITLLGGQARIDRDFWMTKGSGKTDAAMTFVPTYNRIVVIPAEGNYGRVALGQPVATARLGELVGTTSAANKAAQTAGNVAIAASRFLGAFAGGGGGVIGAMHYGNRASYDVRTDEPTFEAELVKGFGKVSASLVTEMAHSR